jgi:cobalt-zinc-cadmium efflux system membrane fusion protein
MKKSRSIKHLCCFAVGLNLLSLGPATAGPGHDHGDTPAVAISGAFPQRQPDGSVFMPKAAQRQLRIQTKVIQREQRSPVIELAGRVVADPNASGKVQTIIAGRVRSEQSGLPQVGQRVEKGQVLAYVSSEIDSDGRSLAQVRLERLSTLTDSIPRRRLEEAQAAAANEVLRAPISGVIATANVSVGQVVESREVLFEVIDPKRLMVEGLLYDPTLSSAIGNATMRIGEAVIPLTLVGVSSALKDQALPVKYRVSGGEVATVQLNLLSTIYANLKTKVDGYVLPLQAIVRGPSNQPIVWIKHDPERFEPRLVTFTTISADQVSVTSGLQDRDRVVTIGASLVNQVR